MAHLATGLKARGHDVEVFIYWPQHAFFRTQVEESGIVIHEYRKRRRFSPGVFRRLAGLIRNGHYDVVVAYLRTPAVYAELAVPFTGRATKLVVSERSSGTQEHSVIAGLRRLLHRFADAVVSNSVSQKEWLERQHPWLAGRCTVIYNGLHISRFATSPRPFAAPTELRLIGVGRVTPLKNLECLMRGLQIFHDRHGWMPAVSWAGRRTDDRPLERQYRDRLEALLDELPRVRDAWTWLGERSDVPALLASHHALVLPSLFEGLPNAICEALAAGLPVLASDVCDHPLLVADGERGFLFHPERPESMAGAMERLVALDPAEWRRVSDAARAFAAESLTVDRMVGQYEQLFRELHAS